MEQELIKCPKCKSTQITASKKGFSGRKAVVGGLLTGGIGILAGTIGSNKIKVHCMACGNSWYPAQYQKQVDSVSQQEEQQKKLDDYKRSNAFKALFENAYRSGNFHQAVIAYKEYKSINDDDYLVTQDMLDAEFKTIKVTRAISTILLIAFLAFIIFWVYTC